MPENNYDDDLLREILNVFKALDEKICNMGLKRFKYLGESLTSLLLPVVRRQQQSTA